VQVRARGEDLELGLRSDVAGALDLPLAGVVVESIGPAAAPPPPGPFGLPGLFGAPGGAGAGAGAPDFDKMMESMMKVRAAPPPK